MKATPMSCPTSPPPGTHPLEPPLRAVVAAALLREAQRRHRAKPDCDPRTNQLVAMARTIDRRVWIWENGECNIGPGNGGMKF